MSAEKSVVIMLEEEERLFDDEGASSEEEQRQQRLLLPALVARRWSAEHPTLVISLSMSIALALFTTKSPFSQTTTLLSLTGRAVRNLLIFLLGALVHDIRIHWHSGLSAYMNLVCALIRFQDAKLWAAENDPNRSIEQEVQKSRKGFEYVMSLIPFPSVEEHSALIPSRTDDHQVPLLVFRPNGTSDIALPVVLFMHGGGMVTGSTRSHASLCAKLAHQTHVIVVSVDYRLAPEHKYPKAHWDCYDALEFLGGKMIPREDRLRVLKGEFDNTRLAVAGDSAGATLAGCVAIEAKQRQIHLCHQLLVYPCTVAYGINPTCPANTVTKSFATAYHGPLLSSRAVIFYTDILFGGDRETTITTSLMSFPRHKWENTAPATIITARHDPLHDEGLLFAKYLKSIKVPVIYNSYNSVHGFWGIPVFDYGNEAFDFTVLHLKRAFANCPHCCVVATKTTTVKSPTINAVGENNVISIS